VPSRCNVLLNGACCRWRMCSVAHGDAVYDILGWAHPWLVVPHDGMQFSTPYQDWDFEQLDSGNFMSLTL